MLELHIPRDQLGSSSGWPSAECDPQSIGLTASRLARRVRRSGSSGAHCAHAGYLLACLFALNAWLDTGELAWDTAALGTVTGVLLCGLAAIARGRLGVVALAAGGHCGGRPVMGAVVGSGLPVKFDRAKRWWCLVFLVAPFVVAWVRLGLL